MDTTLILQRLVRRYHHLLALKIAEFLALSKDDIVVDWASLKVQSLSLSLVPLRSLNRVEMILYSQTPSFFPSLVLD